jgi:hypothetical protein
MKARCLESNKKIGQFKEMKSHPITHFSKKEKKEKKQPSIYHLNPSILYCFAVSAEMTKIWILGFGPSSPLLAFHTFQTSFWIFSRIFADICKYSSSSALSPTRMCRDLRLVKPATPLAKSILLPLSLSGVRLGSKSLEC